MYRATHSHHAVNAAATTEGGSVVVVVVVARVVATRHNGNNLNYVSAKVFDIDDCAVDRLGSYLI